jgi:transcriptional regulator with XRE-family HTH domain
VAKLETFADRLRSLREGAGISQYRLAKRSGLTKQTISRLELGEGAPTWDSVQALARALAVGVEAFVIADAKPAPRKRKGN